MSHPIVNLGVACQLSDFIIVCWLALTQLRLSECRLAGILAGATEGIVVKKVTIREVKVTATARGINSGLSDGSSGWE